MPDSRSIIPEVLGPEATLPADLIALQKFAYFMDEAVAIPGTRRRIGLDAAIGLIPGAGDVIGGLMSAWIVVAALRHRVAAPKILRMVFNILIDVIIGAIPLLGDVFDFLFEENVMNLQLLLRHRDRQRPPRRMGEIAGAAAVVVTVILLASLASAACLIVAIIWIAGKR